MPRRLDREVDVMFNNLWKFATRNGSIVQEKNELEHVYNLMNGCDCESYLEIGTAEGNSLYVLGSAVKENGTIHYVDLMEEHTKAERIESVTRLLHECPTLFINGFSGDSTYPTIHPRHRDYDCILIDGGHDFATVLSDSILYAPLATKYVFWHDMQLPAVREAVMWFVRRWGLGKFTTFINSDSYGFGIMEISK